MIQTLKGFGVMASGLLYYALLLVVAYYGISILLYIINFGFETFVPEFWNSFKTGSYLEYEDFNKGSIYSEERWEQHELEKENWKK